MNQTSFESWIDSWVTYHGVSRQNELGHGQRFKVIQDNATSAALDAGIFGTQWVAKGSLRQVTQPGTDLADDVDKIFSQAVGGPREQIKHEIERLKTRLAELETALKVIDSL